MLQQQQAKDAADLKRAEDNSMPSAQQQADVNAAIARDAQNRADIAAGNPNPTQEPGYTSSGMYGQDSTQVNPDGGSNGDYGKNMYGSGYSFGPQNNGTVTGVSSYEDMMKNMAGGGAPVSTSPPVQNNPYYGGGIRSYGGTNIEARQTVTYQPQVLQQIPDTTVTDSGSQQMPVDNTPNMPGSSGVPPAGYTESFANYYASPKNTAPGPEVLIKFIKQFIR
jgi:hypothetical protein